MTLSSTITYDTLMTSSADRVLFPDIVVSANLIHTPDQWIPTLPLTKAVVTLGPACSNPNTIDQFIACGVTGFRVNMSHVNTEDALRDTLKTLATVRYCASQRKREVAIFADMKGPEFRVVADTSISISPGDRVRITTQSGISGKEGSVVTLHLEVPEDYDLFRDIKNNNQGRLSSNQPLFVVINDAKVRIRLNRWAELFDSEGYLLGTVETGEWIETNKGTNFPGMNLPHLPGLTRADSWVLSRVFDKEFVLSAWKNFQNDEAALKSMVEDAIEKGLLHLLGFDYVAPSFVRTYEDLDRFKHALDSLLAKHVGLIPKIETCEAVTALSDLMIHPLTRGVMVARGDLAAQAGLIAVPHFQQKILDTARNAKRFSIVATDVLGSMTDGKPFATRAEHDGLYRIMEGGASSFMLSNETAVGRNPVGVIQYALETFANSFMEGIQARLPVRAEQRRRIIDQEKRRHKRMQASGVTNESIRQAQIYRDQIRVTIGADGDRVINGIVLWSHRGISARLAAQTLPSVPIIVVTDEIRVAREAAMTRALFPILVKRKPRDGNELREIIHGTLRPPPGRGFYDLAIMHNLGNGV